MAAKGIWVFAEQTNGIQHTCTYELLGKALQLKETLKEEITAVLLGSEIDSLTDSLIHHHADQVILIDDPQLAQYKPRVYAAVLETLCKKHEPSIFLFGATSLGRDLAPRVMAKLKTGLTADVLDLSINEDGILTQLKPSYGGNIMCNIIIPEARPQMATVRPHIFPVLEPDTKATGTILKETIAIEDDTEYEILEEQPIIRETQTIENADFIVAVGRGIGKKENLTKAETLAETCGAHLAVTRPLVDYGWASEENQIGQSGKTVNPKAILNLGISGAVHYTVGMQTSDLIISVNTDKGNALFGKSDYVAIADIKELIPELTKQLKNKGR